MTAIGIEQQHNLGRFIRGHYESLLNTTYVASEIVVRSTDVDRTLMSAQSNLAGLYPALNASDGRVPIQPIPIHTVPTNLDFVRHLLKTIEISIVHFICLVTRSK